MFALLKLDVVGKVFEILVKKLGNFYRQVSCALADSPSSSHVFLPHQPLENFCVLLPQNITFNIMLQLGVGELFAGETVSVGATK